MNILYNNSKCTAFIIFLFAIANCLAQSKPERILLATSKTDHTLSLVDASTLKIIKKLPVGPNPHEVVVSADGTTAYVSNPGNSDLHEINVIDVQNQKTLPNIDTAPFLGPHGMVLQNNKLWFTAQGSKSVARYDTQTHKFDLAIGTGQDVTHLLHVTPNGKKFYTTNVESGTVSIFENMLVEPTIPPTGVLPPTAKPHLDWTHTLITAGQGVEGFDVLPNEKELWAVDPKGNIYIIDTEAKQITLTIKTGILGLHRIAFTPDGKTAATVSVRTGDLLFFDVKSRKEIKRIQTGQGAAMLMDAVDNRLFISCSPNDYIAIIDLKSMEVSGKLEVGGRPDGLEFAVTE
ncbi:YncE family protein [Flavobacterium sp. Sd200]|uniref:YncE family protein n=1 Tax=Flavobacterium sp. Sd200 TaxID=2692211 RepID=UPI00136C23E6|nr:cytochrome D1 domain-containing protein [Flavobacterium sp. Sd200]MXN91796.1 YncE family protein [Flavobacterium sp. Sd200]